MPDLVRYPALAAAMTAVASLGAWAYLSGGVRGRISAELQRYMLTGAETATQWRAGRCLLLPDQTAANFAPECAGEPGKPVVLLWGDSYASSLYPGLKAEAERRGMTVAQYNASACAPLLGLVTSDRPACTGANAFVADAADRLHPRIAVLFGTWMVAEPFIRDGIPRDVARLKAAGVDRIVILGPPPTWTDTLPQIVVDYWLERHELLPARTLYKSAIETTRHIEAVLAAATAGTGAEFVRGTDPFCTPEGCLARVDDGQYLTAYDQGHLTLQGSALEAAYLMDYLDRPRPQ